MAFTPDRLKAAFFALFRASVPRLDRYTTYRAKVISQSSDRTTLDVLPDDPKVPGHSKVPLLHGWPGATVVVPPGSYVMLGFSGADPSAPWCALWPGDAAAIQLVLTAGTMFLGGKPAPDGDLIPVLDGVVTGRGIDAFTGVPFSALGSASAHVMAKAK